MTFFNRSKITFGGRKIVAENMRRVMTAQNLTFTEMANRSGITRTTLVRAESGASQLSGSQLRALAQAIGINIEEFYKK